MTTPPHDATIDGVLMQAVDVVREYALAGVPVQAVRGVSLSVDAGEYAAIVGPSPAPSALTH